MTNNKHSELFEKLLVGFCQEDDPVKSMLEWMTKQLMEIEVTSLKTMVEKGQHSTVRKTHRNGYRVRRWDTRLGTIYLTVPKVRTGGYQPFFLIQKQRSEAALLLLVQEAFTNGVSTRKMKRVLQAFGIENISAAEVSNMTKDMAKEVEQYRNRPLQKHYPVVWIDALYEKVRVDGKVVSMAMMVALAINQEGKKEILAIEPMENESKDTWQVFFEKLQNRGLCSIGIVVSDAHKGILASLKEVFTGTIWQRCKVHFMRNILARVNHSYKKKVANDLKHIFSQTSFKEAKTLSQEVISQYKTKFPEAMECLAEGIEDALQFLHFPDLPKNRVCSTNHLERLNREIRRRSNVVGIFPSVASFLRLIGMYLIEYEEDWLSAKAYIQMNRLAFASNNSLKVA
jgi:putative transposase